MKSRRKPGKPPSVIPKMTPGQEGRLNRMVTVGYIGSPSAVPAGAIVANPNKVRSQGCMPHCPLWYEDVFFNCKDCGKSQRWTARQQQWWYETAGGEIETMATRCKACRVKKRAADAETTKRMREHRRARAEKKAAEMAKKLAAKGMEGFAVLDTPLAKLMISERTRTKLENEGFHTVDDLVAYEPGVTLKYLNSDDMKFLRSLLEELGLTFLGVRVPRG